MAYQPDRESTEKAKADAVLTNVMVAWYSCKERRYHTCLDCPQYWQIEEDNLRITTADKLTHLQVCLTCFRRSADGSGKIVILQITKP